VPTQGRRALRVALLALLGTIVQDPPSRVALVAPHLLLGCAAQKCALPVWDEAYPYARDDQFESHLYYKIAVHIKDALNKVQAACWGLDPAQA